MSYTKQDFKSGEKLYASDLNEMDEQIHQNTESISKLTEEISDLKENGSGGGASLDVQINGTSIVENGIATIPMASKDSFGVSKMFPTNDKNVPGVGVSGNGVLGIVQATNANIDEKTTSKPITPSNLDYAIKSGLTTNALEWTEEEKASARAKLGIFDGNEVAY